MECRHELVQCPYDQSHLVKAGRIQQHLVKCRMNHLAEEFAICPFNACHRMHPAQMRSHLAACPDRDCIEREIYIRTSQQSGKRQSGNLDVPIFNNEPPPCTENWDDDEIDFESNTSDENLEHQNCTPESSPPWAPTHTVSPTVLESPPPERILPLQPRVHHSKLISSTSNSHSKELRLPKNLPKALGPSWGQTLDTPIEDMGQSKKHERLISTENRVMTTPEQPTVQETSPVQKTSTQEMPSAQPTTPERLHPVQISTPESVIPDQVVKPETVVPKKTKPTRRLPTCKSSSRPQKMRTMGRGMLCNYKVTSSGKLVLVNGRESPGATQPPRSLASSQPIRDDVTITNSPEVPAGTHSGILTDGLRSCHVSSSEEKRIKSSSSSSQEVVDDSVTQKTPGVPVKSDEQEDLPPLGRGRGLLTMKFFTDRILKQQPPVGNRSPVFSSVFSPQSMPATSKSTPTFIVPKVDLCDHSL